MTRTRVSVVTAALVLLAANAGAATGDLRREQTARRPYIVEIGEPYAIGGQKLQYEVNHISELKVYVREYGYPDYAEIQEISPEWPWESYEVRLYYMGQNLEVDFGPVLLSAAAPNFGVIKFRGDITPEKRHEIEVVLQAREAPVGPPAAPALQAVAQLPAPPAGGGLTESLVARIEAAAERAAQAADRAAQDSEAAERAAERTVNIVDKMEKKRGAR